MTTGSKPTCGGANRCPYWNAIEAVQQKVSVIATAAPVTTTGSGMGECHFFPPRMAIIAQRGPNGEQIPGTMPLYPVTPMADFCSNHPAIVLERIKIHEITRLRAGKDMVDWDPEKYGGTGFNIAPSLDQAKAIATGPGTAKG